MDKAFTDELLGIVGEDGVSGSFCHVAEPFDLE